VTFGRLYIGSYPIIDSPGWPLRLCLCHYDEPCCGETRSAAIEVVSLWGNGRGFEIEWLVSAPTCAHGVDGA
jgi:hypothetical protein